MGLSEWDRRYHALRIERTWARVPVYIHPAVKLEHYGELARRFNFVAITPNLVRIYPR